MNFLLDTHLLLWLSVLPGRLSQRAIRLIENSANTLYFSPVSIMEAGIKARQKRADFLVDAGDFYHALLREGYMELPVYGRHSIVAAALPLIHKDPFDRLLIAQATVENLTLLTVDATIATYPGPILHV